jgi:hypothetical protein
VGRYPDLTQYLRSPGLVNATGSPHHGRIRNSPYDAMSQEDKLIDLGAERAKRVHDLNEKRLNEVRQAFEQAMPLGKPKKKSKNKPKKR